VKTRLLGHSGITVSDIGFGCMSLPPDRATSTSLLHQALDAGVTFFDTADFYQQGENERMVGAAFAGMRDRVVIASKVGNRWNADGATWRWDPSPSWIAESIHATLHRLRTDYLDLYQLHGGTLEDPIDEIIATFERLKLDGLIRAYGISSVRPAVIREWVARSQLASVMMQYSLLDRRPEEESLDLLHRHGVSVIARGPLARGLLGPKPPAAYLQQSAADVAAVQRALDTVARPGRTRVQLALQFALAHPAVATAIPGASSAQQLRDNLEPCDPLTDTELSAMRACAPASRYDAHR
jgi:aryl-alcohol dehydrogenase-like predicted oxidoreductase